MYIYIYLCVPIIVHSRIMIEEAASNALKYGVAGSALCRVSYGPNPIYIYIYVYICASTPFCVPFLTAGS